MRSKHDFPSLNSKLPEGVKPDGTPYRIVITDDHDFTRKQIRQILESEGYEIAGEAKNGQDALRILDNYPEKIDLITTELDMPVLDGYALLYEMQNRDNPPKVAFISAETTKGVLQDLLKMGATDYILKPIQRSRLLERVKLAVKK